MSAGAHLDLRSTIFGRRSVREYTGQTLGRASIEELLSAAVRAPTAVHEEPWRFLIVQDAPTLKRLSDRAKVLFAEQVKRLHLHRSSSALDAFTRPDFNVFYNAGTLIVICAPTANPFGAADCWLAAQNLMLMAHAMGLGSCVIGSAVAALNEAAMKSELGIPEDHSAIAPIIVGAAAAAAAPSPRRPAQILGWR